jgi:SNF2 family DNA or RNA helicase
MGMGKTLQAIALVVAARGRSSNADKKVTLVVAPVVALTQVIYL